MLRRSSAALTWLAVLLAGVAVVSCRRSLPAAPTGTWEGEIANPRRPYVVTIDFATGRGQIAAGGPVAGKIEAVTASEDRVSFDLRLESETWRFEGVRNDRGLDGSVATPDGHIPLWLAPLPALRPPANRAQAWRQDLDTVLSRFLRYDRSYAPDRREAARARIERLRDAAAGMTDAQVMVELARAIALGGNAYTRLYLMRNRTELRRLPIRVWWFRDELRIVRAEPAHRDLLGCRIVDIDGVDIATATERIRGIKAGNASWQALHEQLFPHAYSKKPYPDREPVFDLDIDSLEAVRIVEPSWDDYLAGADPVYDAALSLLASGGGGRH